MGQTILEINGKRYDARTGKLMPLDPNVQAPILPVKSVDGIVASDARALALAPDIPTVQQSPRAPIEKGDPSRIIHDIARVARPRTQKSKTLMRQSVKKPHATKVSHPSPSANHQSAAPHISPSYASSAHIDARMHKAANVSKHPEVHRFEPTHRSSQNQPIITHMPVQQATSMQPNSAPPLPVNAQSPQQITTEPREAFVAAQLSQVSNKPKRADSTQPKTKKRSRKRSLLSVSSAVVAVLLIVGFLAYQNAPVISLSLAERGAGIEMSLPKGIPGNFALNRNIAYASGQISLVYKSRVDERSFEITKQKDTDNQTSESLKANIERATKGQYQTYQTNGLTLFIAGPGRADWVDGSMRYSISGDSGLTSEQLATIASSL